MIPNYAIIPLLLAAFIVLAVGHYMQNPLRPIRNLNFVMMVLAVLFIFADLFASGLMPWLSIPIFAIALLWLAIGSTLLWRRVLAR
jgi:hypothetical protein